MTGLAMIYKKHLNDADVPQATKKAVTWIKDKILHGYYMTGMEDRYSSFLLKLYLGCIVLLTTESLYRMLTKCQFKLYLSMQGIVWKLVLLT
jgi:hypothetical protein